MLGLRFPSGLERRTTVAFRAHPERFPNGAPVAKEPPTEVWINKPGVVTDDSVVAH
jgi:putative transposase